MNFEVYIQEEEPFSGLRVYIICNQDEKRSVVRNITEDGMDLELIKDNDYHIKPTFYINRRIYKPFLQAMANELHRIGIKPDKQPILENELQAVMNHLDDMRLIVFKQLRIK